VAAGTMMMSDGSSSYRRGCRDFCRCRLDRAQCAAQLCAGELRWHGVSTMRQYLVSAPGVPVRRGQSTVLMSGRNGPQNFGVQSNVGFQQRIPDSGFFRFCAMRRPRSECATSLTRRRSCAQFAICFSRPAVIQGLKSAGSTSFEKFMKQIPFSVSTLVNVVVRRALGLN
jgi:hypothetical protein